MFDTNKIKFGWAERGLVPKGRYVNLYGQFYERITNEVRDELTVTALAVECGGEAAIFCSCALVSTSKHLLCRVRDILKSEADVPIDKIMISAIHTHTGPGYAKVIDTPEFSSVIDILKEYIPGIEYEELVDNSGYDIFDGEEAFDYISKQVAAAALEAWRGRRYGKFASGFGRAAVGMNRRVCYDDGSAKMWGNVDSANFTELEAGNDSGIELMFIADESEKLTGIIANVACPSQVLEHRNFMSADYWADVKKLLCEKYGEDLHLLALCSAAGDQCPRDMIRWVEPETPINDPNIIRDGVTPKIADPSMFDIKGCEKAARRISNEIFWAYEERTPYVDEAPFVHKVMSVDMPIRRVTIEETQKAIEEIKKFGKEVQGNIDFRDKARMHIYAGTVDRAKLQEIQEFFGIEVHIVRLGDIAFATNPYELFLDFGNQIKARSHAKQTMLIQLSCGTLGYLPTKKAEMGSHYSAYVSSGTSGHEGGELLVRKTVSEINKMFE